MSNTVKKIASITIDHNAVTGEYIYQFTRQDKGINLSGGKTLSGHHVITAKETSLVAFLARPFCGVSQITLMLPFWVKIHGSFHYNPDGIIIHSQGRLTLSREVLGVQDASGKSRVIYEVYRTPRKTWLTYLKHWLSKCLPCGNQAPVTAPTSENTTSPARS